MIDLLKNYRQLKTATDYKANVRYLLAKKKLDTLFLRWFKNNRNDVETLLNKIKQGNLKISEYGIDYLRQPIPFFSFRQNLSNSMNMGLNNTITPPRQSNELTCNPSNQIESTKRFSLNESYSQNLGRSMYLGKSISTHQEIKIDSERIPQFYYPQGKPLDTLIQSTFKQQLNSIFGYDDHISGIKCIQFIKKILMLPTYLTPLFIKKHCTNQNKITKDQLHRYLVDFGQKNIDKKAFLLLCGDPHRRHLTIDDFKQLMKIIMEYHPGLEFLKTSPEFQEYYSICVINRMFFMANRKNDYKLTYREFKSSNILKSLYDIQAQSQINANTDYFCYQDFYVIYIKFWQLDSAHKFLLSKQDLSKYSGYTLSRKTVERIYSQVAKKFQHPEHMTFGDFVWFIYCTEDKTTRQSIQYWFKILDLDNNGVVTGYELEFFYEEQYQRLGYMENGSTDFTFENIICQMIDLMKPKNGIQFTVEDFMKRPQQIGIFINTLTDLNKMISYDQRDPYEDRAFKNDHPEWTDWDKFVKPEYKRVEALDENQGEEVINWQNDE